MAEILVVIPSLNQGRYLARNLERLFAEPNSDISVVLMDAGSTDNSLHIIREYGERFKYWRSRPDAGQSAAVNEGASMADAERYVCWVNADDVVSPERLMGLARFLDEHEACVAAHGHGEIIDDEGAVIGRHYSRPFSPRIFASFNTICQPASLIRRQAWERVGGVDEALHFGMDYDLWWKLARIGKIGFVNEVVAQYREHPETKTRSRYDQALKTAIDIAEKYCGYVPLLWVARLRYLRRASSKRRTPPGHINQATPFEKAVIAVGSVRDFIVVNRLRGLINCVIFLLFPNRVIKGGRVSRREDTVSMG
jgi:GT2 family glycosyltransferase